MTFLPPAGLSEMASASPRDAHEERRRVVTIDRHTGERLLYRPRDGAGHAFAQGRHIDGRLHETLRDHRLRRGPREGLFANDHLIEHATETVDVAATVHGLAHGLLGAHVRGRTDRHPALRERVEDGLAHGLPDPEVGHERVPVLQHDVLRLHVAVDDTVAVRVIEGTGHVGGDPHGLLHRELPLDHEPVAQRVSLDVWHHVEQRAACIA